MDSQFEGFPHVIRSQQFSRLWLENDLFPNARRMKRVANNGLSDVLRNKNMVTLFYQPSTRTRMSFEIAMNLLGGKVIFSTENAKDFSSSAKGESLEHTIKVCCRYKPDVIVLRHYKEGSAEIAARSSTVPIINAGDGVGQHPTQALLDLFTIQEALGHIDGISIAIVGDLAKNRVARSLAYLLSKFEGITIHFVSPYTQNMRSDVLDHLRNAGVTFFQSEDLTSVIPSVDVVYMLRAQTESGSIIYDLIDRFFLDKKKAEIARPDAIFMHPLPIDSRVQEIKPEVETDPRSIFLTNQVDNGLYIRMALLEMILAPQL